MNKVLVVSPHFDDAVLSAGQFMAGRPDCDVVTVFAGFPREMDIVTAYDTKTGFKNSREAVTVRRQEDDEALALLHANTIHLDFPDGQYNEPVSKTMIQNKLIDLLDDEDYDFIMGPIGIGHPDHKLVSDAIVSLMSAVNIGFYFWEDLPLRVVEPELVPQRLSEMPPMHLDFPGTGPMADKVRSLWCYKSQIGTGILDPYILYVPERFWRAK